MHPSHGVTLGHEGKKVRFVFQIEDTRAARCAEDRPDQRGTSWQFSSVRHVTVNPERCSGDS
jgi:hypothetical protein